MGEEFRAGHPGVAAVAHPEQRTGGGAGRLVEPVGVVEEAPGGLPPGGLGRLLPAGDRDGCEGGAVGEGQVPGPRCQGMAAHLGHGPVATPDDPQVAGGGEGGGRCVVMPVGDHPLGAADGRVRVGERLVQGLERPLSATRRPRGDPHDVAVAGQCGQCPGVHEDGVDVRRWHVEDQPAGEPQPGGVAPQAVECPLHLGPPEEEPQRRELGEPAYAAGGQQAPREAREEVGDARVARHERPTLGLDGELVQQHRDLDVRTRWEALLHHVRAASSKVSLHPRGSARGSRPSTRNRFPGRSPSSTPSTTPTSSVSRTWPG